MDNDRLRWAIKRGQTGAVLRMNKSEDHQKIKDLQAKMLAQGHQIAAMSKQLTRVENELQNLRSQFIKIEIEDNLEKGLPPIFVPPSIPRIIEAVAYAYGLSIPELLSDDRSRRTTWPRHIAMFLSKRITMKTSSSIGTAFHNRDHTTILHAVKMVESSLSRPDEFTNIEIVAKALGWDLKTNQPIIKMNNPEEIQT